MILVNRLLTVDENTIYKKCTHSDSPYDYKKGFMLIPEESLGPCLSCGKGTIIKFCKKYDGYIGKCTTCDVNWRES